MTSDPAISNLPLIQERINRACRRAGRTPEDVQLLLATKTVSVERLENVASAGYRLFGENKAQELLSKVDALKSVNPEWHFIGHLQSNKVKDIVPHCRLIHSVDRLSLAQEISKRAALLNLSVSILIEVNTSGEVNKSGVDPGGAAELARHISQLQGLKVKGLMTLAMASENTDLVRGCFRTLRTLSTELSAEHLPHCEFEHLSMGMSQDFEIAIEEGATLIRIGSLAFGHRPPI